MAVASPAQGNFDHGAWKSGDKLEAKRDAFESYLEKQSPEYFENFSERVANDRNELYDADLHPADCMADWMNTRALRNRGQYAAKLKYKLIFPHMLSGRDPNNKETTLRIRRLKPAQVKQKAWFGLQSCLRDLLFDWTIQEEALHALLRHLAARRSAYALCTRGRVPCFVVM